MYMYIHQIKLHALQIDEGVKMLGTDPHVILCVLCLFSVGAILCINSDHCSDTTCNDPRCC